MTNPTGQAPAPEPARAQPAPPPAPHRGVAGCVGRLLSALLVIVATTAVALTAGAAGLLWLGFTPATPAELKSARSRVAELETRQALQAAEATALAQRLSSESETIGDIQRELTEIRALRDELRAEVDEGIRQNATLVAEARAGRDQVAAFATAEASRAALIAEIERRSERVERFLLRLSDISEDAALDLGGGTPAPPDPATPAAPAPATPTPPPASAPPAPSATPTPTPITSPDPTEPTNPTPTPP